MTSVMPTETITIVATWVRLTLSVCQAGEMRRHGEIEGEQHDQRGQRGVAPQEAPERRAAARRRAAVGASAIGASSPVAADPRAPWPP